AADRLPQLAENAAPPLFDDDMILGKADAPVTIIEYASLTCPHCAHFSTTTFPKIRSELIEPGKVRWVYRDLPLDHRALLGALLAHCVPKEQYFATIDVLFATQEDWSSAADANAALGRRRSRRRSADHGRRGNRLVEAARCRAADPAGAGLARLLALARRRRHPAQHRLVGVRQRRRGDDRLAGPEALLPLRPADLRLRGRGRAADRRGDRAAGRAGPAARRSRLRRLRQCLRALQCGPDAGSAGGPGAAGSRSRARRQVSRAGAG